MLNNIINIVAVLAMAISYINKNKMWLGIYLVSLFIAPVFILGSTRIAYDIVVFPVLLFLYLLRYKGKLRIQKDVSKLCFFGAIYVLITLVVSLVLKAEFPLLICYAGVRFIGTLIIIYEEFGNECKIYLNKVCSVVIIGNFIACVTQILRIIPVQFFYDLYYRPSSTPLRGQLEIGYFQRAFGLTSSPIIIGAISLLFCCYFMNLCINEGGKKNFNGIKLLMSLLCGWLALSKTAIIGIPLMAVIIVICSAVFYKKKMGDIIKVMLIVPIMVLIIYVLVNWMGENGFSVKYYMSFLSNPLKAFSTRYDTEDGILAPAIEVIKENFLFGVGRYNADNVFLGDSSYIVIMYETGIVGLVSYLLPYIVSLFRAFAQKNVMKITVIVGIFVIMVASSLHWTGVMVLFTAIVLMDTRLPQQMDNSSFEN